MSIGLGIVLFVIGAILTFALNITVDWINLQLVGYILMGAGVLVFLISLILVMRSRRTESVARTEVDPATGERVTRRSIRNTDPLA